MSSASQLLPDLGRLDAGSPRLYAIISHKDDVAAKTASLKEQCYCKEWRTVQKKEKLSVEARTAALYDLSSKQVVIAGSRSSALTMAVAMHPRANVTTCIDERSLGFWALGHGRATGYALTFNTACVVSRAMSSEALRLPVLSVAPCNLTFVAHACVSCNVQPFVMARLPVTTSLAAMLVPLAPRLEGYSIHPAVRPFDVVRKLSCLFVVQLKCLRMVWHSRPLSLMHSLPEP